MKKILIKVSLSLVVLLGVLLGMQSCNPESDIQRFTTTSGLLSEKMILDFLDSHPDKYSQFSKALRLAKIDNLLTSYGRYTCFVPNDTAVISYLKSIGKDSIGQLSTNELKDFIYFHLVDGQAQTNKILYTSDNFNEGLLGAKNMYGRSIATTYRNIAKGYITVNASSHIIERDSICKNGVVHTIDKVMEPIDFLISEAIQRDARFNIFAKALYETHLSDSIVKVSEPFPSMDPAISKTIIDLVGYNKIFAYTVFAETDEVYKQYGINSYEDLKAKFDDGVGSSVQDPRNGLNRFVAYHIMPVMKYMGELYPEPMMTLCPNTLIDFDLKDESLKYPANVGTNYANVWNFWKKFAVNDFVINRGTTTLNTSGYIEIDYSMTNNSAINGVYHGIKQLLDVTEQDGLDRQGAIRLQKRLRFDVWNFIPEPTNCRLRTFANKADIGSSFPKGYLTNFTSNNETTVPGYGYSERWIGLYNDGLAVSGWVDFTLTTPPIPAGTWEIRYGFGVNNQSTALIQSFFDGEIQGVPFVNKINCAAQYYGWKKDIEAPLNNDPVLIATNDLEMRNLGMMKYPLSAISQYYNSGRYDISWLRRIVCVKTFNKMERHTLRMKSLASVGTGCDFIEFIPVDKIAVEDKW